MNFNAYQDTNAGILNVSVVSSGHIFAEQGRTSYRPNGRNDFLLLYVNKGEEVFFTDTRYTLYEGSFILYRPKEMQKHIHLSHEVGELYYVHFNAPSDFDLLGFKSFTPYIAEKSSAIAQTFEKIIYQLQTKQPEYELVCAALLLSILANLKQRLQLNEGSARLYSDKISYVIQKMNTEYNVNYTLDDYARMCALSKFHFLRVFKEITGTSPVEYRNNIRLSHAKELLCDTNESISTICALTGYTSGAYFCDVFKKKTGLSPSEYRKEKTTGN